MLPIRKMRLLVPIKFSLFGLSGHNAGSFTATAFIVKSAGQGGVLIGSPAAASTWLPAAIVACAANISAFASLTCCGECGSIVVNNDSQLRECRYLGCYA